MSINKRAESLSKRDKKVINRVVDYQTVFNSEEGQRVLQDLIDQGYVIRPTQVEHSEIASFVNEGKRNIVLYILSQLEINAKDLLTRLTSNIGEDDEIYL